jgi:hypothetical protein
MGGERLRGESGVWGALPDSMRETMAHSIEQLIDPAFVQDLPALPLDEVRARRGRCQDAEEALSLRRRLVQGRLDIVQAELYRRTGGGSDDQVKTLVEQLPSILVEHGDRHLGPGRLTSVDTSVSNLGSNFDAFEADLDRIVDGARLSSLKGEDETQLRDIADRLDVFERMISGQRHALHRHIDLFQEEIVRRYKTGEASVDGLLGQ